MKAFYRCFGVLVGFGAGASDFGSVEQSRALADRVIAVYAERGLSGAIDFIHDPQAGLGGLRLGVNLMDGGRVVADNREPETVGFDYTSVIDLSGALIWDRIVKALENGDEEILTRWAHYDTGAAYDYHCILRDAENGRLVVMICR